jgi:dolichol kinase
MISRLAIKIGGAWILFVALGISLYYLFKKYLGSKRARILSPLLSALLVFSLYRFDFPLYLSETRWLMELLLSNLPSLLGIFIVAFAAVTSAYHLSSRLRPETYRSIYHSFVLCLIGVSFLFNPDLGFLCLSFVIISLLFSEVVRATHEPPRSFLDVRGLFALLKEGKVTEFLTQLVHRGIGTATRGEEIRLYTAGFFALLGVTVVFLSLPFKAALASLFILALADPTAASIGRRFGLYRWSHNPSKSLEGSLGAFIVSFLVVLAFGFRPELAVLVAGSVMIFESFPLLMSDNLILPLLSAMLLCVPI